MDMRKHRLISEFDGLRLDVEEVVPDRIRGIVQISHGMAEHKERYEEFMKFLAEHDYMAVIHDHRGHGNSVNDLVELGYFYTEDIQGISIYIIWLLRDMTEMKKQLITGFLQIPKK